MSALNYIKSSPRSLILDFFFFLIFAILFLDKFLGTLQFYLKLYNHIFFNLQKWWILFSYKIGSSLLGYW